MMEKKRKNGIWRTLRGAALLTVVILGLASCTVAVESGSNPAPPATGGYLPAPTVYATQGYYGTSVSLTWSEVVGAISYNYYYATSVSGFYQYLGNTALKSASVFVPYSSTSYFFKVTAISATNVEGYKSASATGWAYLATAPILTATTNLTGQIYVTWNPVYDAVGYNVYDSTTGTKIYLGKGVLEASGTYYYYFDTVYPGTYYYKVESIYADNGISALSAEIGGHAY